MQAGAGLSDKTPPPLVGTAGPWVKAGDSPSDGPGNGGVVANLEMERINLLIASPITAPELVGVVDTERHRHRLVRLTPVGAEQHQAGTQLLGCRKKKVVGEIFASPWAPTAAVLGIKIVHAVNHGPRNGLPHQGGHLQARRGHRLAFPLDIAPLVGVKAGQIALERAEPWIGPQPLLVDPRRPACRLGEGTPDRIHVQEIAAQDLVLAAKRPNMLKHQHREGRGIFPGREQKAIALHRAQRAHPHKLGVVTQP